MHSQAKAKLVALSAVTFVMVFGNSMLIPIFTQIQTALEISFLQVSLLVTYYSIAAAIFIPVFGFLSDRFNRKWVIISALSLYGLAGVFIGLLVVLKPGQEIYTLILIGRVIQGIGAAGMSPIAMALVGDIFTSEERAKALGLIEFSNIFGKIVSPIIGSALALLLWFIPFFLYGVFVVPVLIAILFLITEPDKKEEILIDRYFSDIKRIFAHSGRFLWAAYLGGWTSFFILFGVLTFISDILGNYYSITGIIKGIIIAIPVTAWAISSFFSGYYLEKQTEQLKKFVLTGLFMLGTASLLLSYIENLHILLGIIFFMGVGGGLVIPSLTILVTNCAPLKERGGIMSLYGSIRFIGVAMGPYIFTILTDINSKYFFWLSAVLALLVLVFFAYLKNKEIAKLCKVGDAHEGN